MKIRPIKVSKSGDVKAASKTMSDVLSFHISLANELNRVIEDINKIGASSLVTESENSKLEKQIKSIKQTADSQLKEIRSNRQESGLALDRVEQAIIRLEKK